MNLLAFQTISKRSSGPLQPVRRLAEPPPVYHPPAFDTSKLNLALKRSLSFVDQNLAVVIRKFKRSRDGNLLDKENRRRFQRKFTNLKAAIEQEGGSIQLTQFVDNEVFIRNISEEGACLELSRNGFDLAVSECKVSIPHLLMESRVSAKKIWSSKEANSQRLGIKFAYEDIALRHAIRSYLSKPTAAKFCVGLYETPWERKLAQSLLGLVRDSLVLLFPFRLPKPLIRFLYGVEPRYIFYVHPRRKEDLFISFPLLKYLRPILPQRGLRAFASALPPFVIGSVQHTSQSGLIIATLQMPNELLGNMKHAIKKARMAVRLAGKICSPPAVLGLGAWWPMVTRRGLALGPVGKRHKVTITNGHCGTLVSIYLMVQKIAELAGLKMQDLHIGIIGVGKTGQNIARALDGRVGRLFLLDVNQKKLDAIVNKLQGSHSSSTIIESVCLSSKDESRSCVVLERAHVFVCATSNIRKLSIGSFLPKRSIIIDDSRPEAFFRRHPFSGRLVLEGGLLKILGVKIDYDFGFGVDENVFGCLAESYLLSLDRGKTLEPTLGSVKLDNFCKMLSFAREQRVEVGDFKSGRFTVSGDLVSKIIKEKHSELPSFY